MAQNPTEKITAVRTRVFKGAAPEDVLDQARKEKVTGRIIVDMSQGGTGAVQIEEHQKIET